MSRPDNHAALYSMNYVDELLTQITQLQFELATLRAQTTTPADTLKPTQAWQYKTFNSRRGVDVPPFSAICTWLNEVGATWFNVATNGDESTVFAYVPQPEAQRQGMEVVGELVVTADDKQLVEGDGHSLGGKEIKELVKRP